MKNLFAIALPKKENFIILPLISDVPDLDHVQGVIGAVQGAALEVAIVEMIGKYVLKYKFSLM